MKGVPTLENSLLKTINFGGTGINWYLVSAKKKNQGVPFFEMWVHLCNIFFTFVTYFLHIVHICVLVRLMTNKNIVNVPTLHLLIHHWHQEKQYCRRSENAPNRCGHKLVQG